MQCNAIPSLPLGLHGSASLALLYKLYKRSMCSMCASPMVKKEFITRCENAVQTAV